MWLAILSQEYLIYSRAKIVGNFPSSLQKYSSLALQITERYCIATSGACLREEGNSSLIVKEKTLHLVTYKIARGGLQVASKIIPCYRRWSESFFIIYKNRSQCFSWTRCRRGKQDPQLSYKVVSHKSATASGLLYFTLWLVEKREF